MWADEALIIVNLVPPPREYLANHPPVIRIPCEPPPRVPRTRMYKGG